MTDQPISRVRRLEMALEFLSGVLSGARDDLNEMKRWHSPSKRGSNYTRNLESLERRLAGAEEEISEAMNQA